jgi:hypothetical protein
MAVPSNRAPGHLGSDRKNENRIVELASQKSTFALAGSSRFRQEPRTPAELGADAVHLYKRSMFTPLAPLARGFGRQGSEDHSAALTLRSARG